MFIDIILKYKCMISLHRNFKNRYFNVIIALLMTQVYMKNYNLGYMVFITVKSLSFWILFTKSTQPKGSMQFKITYIYIFFIIINNTLFKVICENVKVLCDYL